jgi:hypothetical protein
MNPAGADSSRRDAAAQRIEKVLAQRHNGREKTRGKILSGCAPMGETGFNCETIRLILIPAVFFIVE